ncbi:MAG TPA: hypothetical protein VGV90_15045 [Solirubrobacteraceae bacterium]|nr:hypothetical protein [Solirubrobacteraceae bacterium]
MNERARRRRRRSRAAGIGWGASLSGSRRLALGALLVVLIVGGWVLLSGGDEPRPARIGYVGQDLVGLKLDRQVQQKTRYWEAYDGHDAPEGGFLGWMLPGANSLSARVPLRRTIDPGKYHVFLKTKGYERPVDVGFALGGGAATVSRTKDDPDWSAAIPITVESATDELSLRLRRTDESNDNAKLLLRGLYLTTDGSEVVLPSDRVVALNYPEDIDDSSPRAGNLVANGSFEVGLGHGWGSTDDRRFGLASIADAEAAKDGRASVKLPLDPAENGIDAKSVSIVSKPFSVSPNKRHTLSVWLKSETGDPVAGELTLLNSYGPPAAPEIPGKRGQHSLSKDFQVGGDWTRVDLSGPLLRYPTADYHIRIAADVTPGRHLWIDAVSLNEGGPAPYAAKTPLEIGIERTRPSNLYYDDEPVRMRLRAHNASGDGLRSTIRYEIYDYLNRKVRAGSRRVDVPKASIDVSDLDVGVGRRGIFRLVMWVAGQDGSEEEVIYGVVPRTRRAGADRASAIGIHSNFTDFGYAAIERLGIKWDRAMSPGQFFRWSVAEPEEGKFVWFDDEIRRAARHGISVLGTLGFRKEWPEFADDDGLPDLDRWENFVEQTARHYRGDVKAWEIWNEPNYEFEPDFYARMLKRAAEAVKRTDPAAEVVAMGGPYDVQFMKDVFDELRKQYPDWPRDEYIDVLSMHMYPAREQAEESEDERAAAFRKEILPAHRQPLWNTESGEWDTGFYRTSNAVRQPWGKSLFGVSDPAQFAASSPRAIRSLSTTFLETIGNGLDKFFYYDFRVQASPTYALSHPSMLEYDDTVRPKGIAYAALAHLFDRARGGGRIALANASVRAYPFNRNGVPLVGLYTLDDRLRSITPAGVGAGRLNVYDSMGNRVATPGGRIALGPTPIYVEGPGVSVDALRQAFRRGTVARREDRSAPSLSIDQGPRGPVEASAVALRWSATDDAAVPSAVSPRAITYSYRLRGADGKDAWSPWTQRSAVDFDDLSAGRYSFDVRARDASGNRSRVVSRPIEVR